MRSVYMQGLYLEYIILYPLNMCLQALPPPAPPSAVELAALNTKSCISIYRDMWKEIYLYAWSVFRIDYPLPPERVSTGAATALPAFCR